MRNALLSLALLTMIVGCTTVDVVRKDLSPTKLLVLRYTPQSDHDREAQRRDIINQKALDFCGGEFHIIREYEALEETGGYSGVGIGTGFGFHHGFGTAVSVGTTTPHSQMYRFVEVECGPAPVASPTPAVSPSPQASPGATPKAKGPKATPPRKLPLKSPTATPQSTPVASPLAAPQATPQASPQ